MSVHIHASLRSNYVFVYEPPLLIYLRDCTVPDSWDSKKRNGIWLPCFQSTPNQKDQLAEKLTSTSIQQIIPFLKLTDNCLGPAACFSLQFGERNWVRKKERLSRTVKTLFFKFLLLFPRDIKNVLAIVLNRCFSGLRDDCVCLMNTTTFARQFNRYS